jgi:hypothetical protein
MVSPLEEDQKILEKIGLFTVLFNLIEDNLSMEFVYIINQTNQEFKLILDFLYSQQIFTKLNILKNFTGNDICSKIIKINDFRNHLSHGVYGKNSSGFISNSNFISNSKRTKEGGYKDLLLDEKILDDFIKRERDILNEFHKLRLKRMGK